MLRIKEKLEVGLRFKELLVVGDQQTWKYMDELKSEYAEVFGWLLHMPGDWHSLLNTQPVMKKMFLHAGLEELAAKFGYQEGSIKGTLEENKSFRRNHWFLIESWEGMFGAMILIFLKEKGWDVGGASLEDVVKRFNQQEPFTGSPDEARKIEAALLARLHETLAQAGFEDSEGLRKEFLTWGEQRLGNSKTWAF